MNTENKSTKVDITDASDIKLQKLEEYIKTRLNKLSKFTGMQLFNTKLN